MGDALVRRRGHGEDAIYFPADKNRYIDSVSIGFGPHGCAIAPIRRAVSRR
jgi:hypothetical protein